jgi:thymidylate synthase (FAD)
MPMENRINLLDHGFVRLIDSMGDDLSVVRAARVSYDAAWRAGEDHGGDAKLLNYLWKNHHTTPFEAVTFTFEVKAPIFVFRQWHRHRTFSYNELSARYRELPKEYYVPKIEDIGQQSTATKQARDLSPTLSRTEAQDRTNEQTLFHNHCEESFRLYNYLLAKGWPRELARSVLPVATYSHMFCTANLLNLLKFLTLRCDSHAQYEIRVYADAMRELIRPIAPVCVSAWESTFNKVEKAA